MGLVFVLDRATGEPFLPIEERPVVQTGAPGEALSPTQPFPAVPPPVVPNRLSPDDAFGMTWFDRRACRQQIARARSEGLFTPPSEQGTILYPFTGGGANWGGAAFDPMRNLLVINMSSVAHHVQLIPADQVEAMEEAFPDAEVSTQAGAPFGMKRELLMSPLGIPCTPPPWGVLAGVDLARGEIVWRKTLGEIGVKLGTPTLGGPIVTAGGLVFIGATMDSSLRAFDVATGEERWQGNLPAPGLATPMTYMWEGRQYVVIFAGGNAITGLELGDTLIAFAVPDRSRRCARSKSRRPGRGAGRLTAPASAWVKRRFGSLHEAQHAQDHSGDSDEGADDLHERRQLDERALREAGS